MTARRLFFALWPDATVREPLVRLQRGLGDCGRSVPPENLHVTLRFLGDTDETRIAALKAVATAAVFEPFAWRLDRLGLWPRTGILWAGTAATPPALGALATTLSVRLEELGIEPERRPFQAHCTLFRKSRRRPRSLEITPICWSVDEFVLVESRLDGRGASYAVIERFPARRPPVTAD